MHLSRIKVSRLKETFFEIIGKKRNINTKVTSMINSVCFKRTSHFQNEKVMIKFDSLFYFIITLLFVLQLKTHETLKIYSTSSICDLSCVLVTKNISGIKDVSQRDSPFTGNSLSSLLLSSTLPSCPLPSPPLLSSPSLEQQGNTEDGRLPHGALARHWKRWQQHQEGDGGDGLPHSFSGLQQEQPGGEKQPGPLGCGRHTNLMQPQRRGQYLLALRGWQSTSRSHWASGNVPNGHEPRSAVGIKGFTLSGSVFGWVLWVKQHAHANPHQKMQEFHSCTATIL